MGLCCCHSVAEGVSYTLSNRVTATKTHEELWFRGKSRYTLSNRVTATKTHEELWFRGKSRSPSPPPVTHDYCERIWGKSSCISLWKAWLCRSHPRNGVNECEIHTHAHTHTRTHTHTHTHTHLLASTVHPHTCQP